MMDLGRPGVLFLGRQHDLGFRLWQEGVPLDVMSSCTMHLLDGPTRTGAISRFIPHHLRKKPLAHVPP